MEITEKNMNADNVFEKYINAIGRKDHAEVAKLEKEAMKGVVVKQNRPVRHVSLKQMRAIGR